MTALTHRLARFGPLALVILLAVAAYASGLLHHLTMDRLAADQDVLEAYIALHPFLSVVIYIAVFSVAVTLCLPLGLVLTLAGGLLFGAAMGGAAACLGSTLGGTALFLICRTAIGDGLKALVGPRMARLETQAGRSAFALVLSLRLVPMMPPWLINIGAAGLKAPLGAFFLATLLGIAPSSFVYAGIGSGLGALFAQGSHFSGRMLMAPSVILPLLGLTILAFAAQVYRWLRR